MMDFVNCPFSASFHIALSMDHFSCGAYIWQILGSLKPQGENDDIMIVMMMQWITIFYDDPMHHDF